MYCTRVLCINQEGVCIIFHDFSISKRHDDVIKWKHFPRYWPFVREFTGHRWIPAQSPVTRSFDVYCNLHDKD